MLLHICLKLKECAFCIQLAVFAWCKNKESRVVKREQDAMAETAFKQFEAAALQMNFLTSKQSSTARRVSVAVVFSSCTLLCPITTVLG